jgi:hypothetical protein
MLVNEAFGCFYEFNDSEVKPMTLGDTKKAFEGRDSAYLVVYRDCNSDLSVPTFAHSKAEHMEDVEILDHGGTSAKPPRFVDEPPKFWLDKAMEMNAHLALERDMFKTHGGGKLNLNILCPVHLDATKPPLFPKVSIRFLALLLISCYTSDIFVFRFQMMPF